MRQWVSLESKDVLLFNNRKYLIRLLSNFLGYFHFCLQLIVHVFVFNFCILLPSSHLQCIWRIILWKNITRKNLLYLIISYKKISKIKGKCDS